MKKILISVLILIVAILIYMTLVNGMYIGSFKIESIDGVKQANSKLEGDFIEVSRLKDQEYPQQIKTLKTAIDTLTTTKEKYESRIKYAENGANFNTVLLKTYEIVYLWTNVDGHAKKHGIGLDMNLREGATKDIYNLDFILNGAYIGITNFIYDIENDSNLDFRIENFALTPGGISTEQGANTGADTNKLQATFTVSDVGIKF